MRKILGIRMGEVKEEKTTNVEVRRRLGNTKNTIEVWRETTSFC